MYHVIYTLSLILVWTIQLLGGDIRTTRYVGTNQGPTFHRVQRSTLKGKIAAVRLNKFFLKIT